MVSVGLTAPMETEKLESTRQRLSIACSLQLTSRTEVAGSVPNLAVSS